MSQGSIRVITQDTSGTQPFSFLSNYLLLWSELRTFVNLYLISFIHVLVLFLDFIFSDTPFCFVCFHVFCNTCFVVFLFVPIFFVFFYFTFCLICANFVCSWSILSFLFCMFGSIVWLRNTKINFFNELVCLQRVVSRVKQLVSSSFSSLQTWN